MADYKLGIIGSGNMAEAILSGVVDSGILAANQIIASDVSVDRREVIRTAVDHMRLKRLNRRSSIIKAIDFFRRNIIFDINGNPSFETTGNNASAAGCEQIILAVKPQIMGDVLDEIADSVNDDTLVISIAAGITSSFIDEMLKGKGRIVRVMPNTPMLVNAGMSAIAKGPRATEDDLAWTERIFAACGETVRVTEDKIDAVIAVSGSGPAYFFYLVEAMIHAGVAEGLDESTAKLLAVQTCKGAAELMISTGEKPEELRRRVTSPGGTTEAAIKSMEAAGVKQSLIKAMRACAARSRELGK